MSRRVAAATLVTAITLVLVGGIVVLTPLGCGPAATLGLNAIGSHCKTTASLIPLSSPSPPGTPTNVALASSSPASTPSPETSPSPTPSSRPTPPSSSSAPSPYPPYFPPASGNAGPTYPLTCKLPVYAEPQAQVFNGGFIQFPAGTFVADPASTVSVPAGTLQAGLTYDRSFSRWLPVPYSQVSPDGSQYAYTGGDGIHVVTLATGTDKALAQSPALNIVSVGAAGVYAAEGNHPGLWLLTLAGGVQQVTATGFWTAATGGYAYGSASETPGGTILRLDLKTGATTDWFTLPIGAGYVRGLDAQGNPVIQDVVTNQQQEVWIAKGPADASPIFGWSEGLIYASGPIADLHGVWISTHTGTVLFVPGSGVYWMFNTSVVLAGGCG